MKLSHLIIGTAGVALLAGAAYAQQPQPPAAPTPGSVTGDWNGAHAPPDDKQYQEKVAVPVGAASSTATDVAATTPPPAEPATTTATSTTSTDVTAPAATSAGVNTSAASFSNLTVTNGPIPDTPANRKKYGQPLSHAGKMTAARGN
jgi:hypothetical protein